MGALCRSWLVASLFALFTALWSGRSVAAPSGANDDTRERARAHFQRASEAYDHGRYKDAIEEFTRANEIAPSAALSYNVARAYERLGDDASALAFYRAFLRRQPSAPDRERVSERIAALESSLRKKGVQQLTVLTEPEHATVVLDDTPVGVTPWNGEVAPGQHRLVVRLSGHRDVERDVQLPADHAIDVSVTLEAERPPSEAEAAAPPAPSSPAPRREPKPESSGPADARGARVSVLTWTSFGIGALAFAGAAGFEISRVGAARDSRDARTQVEAQDAYDRMESRQGAARILAGVGAVATLAGGVLLYLDLSRSRSSDVTLRAGCRPPACGLSAAGSF
jgi:tetratricopeptide (TPR) repeat protein